MRDGVILVESSHVVHGAYAMMQRKRAIDNYGIVMDRAAVGFWLIAISMLTVWKCDAHAQSGTRFFDTTLGEFRSELVAARRESKAGVLLVFEMAGCPSCRRMREEVLDRGDVRTYYRQRFRIYSVDIHGDVPVRDFNDQELREKDLAKAFKVWGTPTFVFVGVDGTTLATFTGATRDAKEFLALGHYVADGAHRTQTFKQYFRR